MQYNYVELEKINDAIAKLRSMPYSKELEKEMLHLQEAAENLEKKADATRSAWEKVLMARKPERPRGRFFIEEMVSDFIELHGDRVYGDDTAIIGGIGKLGEHVVTIIAVNRGTTAKENIACNFGMPHPEGYRKALRLMKQAEKFHRPIVCLIDTPGAYCGIGAEERGQGAAIAQNLMTMAELKVPIISGILGEGGSGGALALGVADKVFMLQNAIYSILSPEGFSSILWKDASRAPEAAEKMKMTANDLLEYGIIDDIINEPSGGAHKNPKAMAAALKEYLIAQLSELKKMPLEEILYQRYGRYRNYGQYQ